MSKHRWLVHAVDKATRAHDAKRAKGAVKGPIGRYLRHHLEVVEELRAAGRSWNDVAAILAQAHPQLHASDGRPLAEAPNDLRKTTHREKKRRSAADANRRRLIGMAGLPNTNRPSMATLLDRAPARSEPGNRPDQESGSDAPDLATLGEKIRRRT